MFTGIIEEIGTVSTVRRGSKSVKLTIKAQIIFSDLKLGDSVSTNGVCLTVTSINGLEFSTDVMNESLLRSSLGELKNGSLVNLERAMPSNGRFGGHIVSGHIDGTGKITKIKRDDISIWYTVKTNHKIMKYIIEKGSIAIDGISLTVAKVECDCFSVSIIPHTAQETTLLHKEIGATVNLENDIVGKYIEKFIAEQKKITKEFLMKHGY